MFKKILIIFFIVIVVAITGILAYEKILGDRIYPFYSDNNDNYKTAIEVIKNDPTNSFGAVTLVDHNGIENYCNLTDADSCLFEYNESASFNLLAYPAEGFAFDKWIGGCDEITMTYQEGDTCAVISYSGVKTTIVSFIKK